MDGIEIGTELSKFKQQTKSEINDLMEFNNGKQQTSSNVIQEIAGRKQLKDKVAETEITDHQPQD